MKLSIFLLALALCYVLDSAQGASTRKKRSVSVDGLTGKEELNFQGWFAAGFEQFKKDILKEIPADCPVFTKDIVLAKFFRANLYNMDIAKKAVRATLEWRKENKMEKGTLRKEDLSAARKQFEASTDVKDVQGRPVLYMQTGKWKLIKALESEDTKVSYERAYYQLFDEVCLKTLKSFEEGGKNAQYVLVFNYDQWETMDGACPDCVTLVSRLAYNFENYYPRATHQILLINVSEDFHFFLDVIRVVLSQETNDKLKTYGRKESEWLKDITTLIAEKDVRKLLAAH